jgi:hypothetical protein
VTSRRANTRFDGEFSVSDRHKTGTNIYLKDLNMSDPTKGQVQLTQAVLQRRIGADTGLHEPNVLLIEGLAERGWVSGLGRQALARVEECMREVTDTWRRSDTAMKADRLIRESTAAEAAEGEARRLAATLEDELATALDECRDTAAVEDRLAAAKSELARVTVRAGVLRHLLDKARAEARAELRRALEGVRLNLHQQARLEHQAALRALESVVIEHFPAVNQSGYVFTLTKTAEVTEHHLCLAGFEPQPAAEQRAAS